MHMKCANKFMNCTVERYCTIGGSQGIWRFSLWQGVLCADAICQWGESISEPCGTPPCLSHRAFGKLRNHWMLLPSKAVQIQYLMFVKPISDVILERLPLMCCWGENEASLAPEIRFKVWSTLALTDSLSCVPSRKWRTTCRQSSRTISEMSL